MKDLEIQSISDEINYFNAKENYGLYSIIKSYRIWNSEITREPVAVAV